VVEDPLFYTETMARLLIRQGKRREAAEIYRYLLAKDSNRQDIRGALAQLEECPGGGRNVLQQETADLFARWIALALRVQAVERLKACLKLSGKRPKEETP